MGEITKYPAPYKLFMANDLYVDVSLKYSLYYRVYSPIIPNKKACIKLMIQASIWLPTPATERTPLVLTIHMPIYFIFNKDKRLEIREGKAPYGISTDKRITKRLLKQHKPVICKLNPITIAIKYQEIYAAKGSMEKVAQEFGVSRVRIHQMLNLLKLDQRIIKYLLNLTDPKQINYWREHRLRKIATLPKEKQYAEFTKISKTRFSFK